MGRRGRTRWLAAGALALVATIYIAHLFFFCAGSGLGGGLSWRMDRGRVAIEQITGGRQEPFWMELGSNGIRWSVEWRRYNPEGWRVVIPLWIPLGLCLAWCAVSWRRRATAPAAAGS